MPKPLVSSESVEAVLGAQQKYEAWWEHAQRRDVFIRVALACLERQGLLDCVTVAEDQREQRDAAIARALAYAGKLNAAIWHAADPEKSRGDVAMAGLGGLALGTVLASLLGKTGKGDGPTTEQPKAQ